MEELREEFPFPVTGFDTGNGSEFINHDVADWLQKEDIAFTRS
ncbi:MAG: transposase, partial [Actinobacteria bacterium]|nr:transposase [Actinomycetota bacterium]